MRGELGRGAFGTVYRAFDSLLHREVALKVPRFPADRADLVERFLREARTAARLSHPNIVTVHDCGEDGGRYFIASELIDGETLAGRLLRGRPDHRQAAQWARDLALALHYAHELTVVHRDVKPANILLDRGGRVRLTDFGLAKWVADAAPFGEDGGAAATRLGAVMGTPAYMSPEQARGEPADRASDQYGLGVVLYEMLTGRTPYSGSARSQMEQTADIDEPVPLPRGFAPDVPADLEAVLIKALEKRPRDRYASAAEFAADLQRWFNGTPVLARAAAARRKAWQRHPDATGVGARRIRRCDRCGRVSPADRRRCQYCEEELSGPDEPAPGRDPDGPARARSPVLVRIDAAIQMMTSAFLIAVWFLIVLATASLFKHGLGRWGDPFKPLLAVPILSVVPMMWQAWKGAVAAFELVAGAKLESLDGVADFGAREWLIASALFVPLGPAGVALVWAACGVIWWACDEVFLKP